MKIANQASGNSGGDPEFARESYKVRAMPGKLRPSVAPERAKGVLVIVLAILIIGGLIGGEVYLYLTKPDISGIKGQISEHGANLAEFGKKLENQSSRIKSLEEETADLPSKKDFDSLKTSLASLEKGQEDLKARIGLKDQDQDGIPDVWEEKYKLNSKDRRDAKLDPDSDGLINLYEYLLDTDPTNPDTDKDGYKDGTEVENGYNPKGKGKLSDILKVKLTELSPKEEKKSEEVTKPAHVEGDTDEDGMPDDWEKKYNLDPDDPTDAQKDLDKDGLINLDEYKFETDPTKGDTDKDGFLDGEEVSAGYNPAGSGKLKEIENLKTQVKGIEDKAKEAEKGIFK